MAQELGSSQFGRTASIVVVGATAADGGPLAADLASRLNDDAWCEAVRLMLGAQVLEQDERPELAIALAGGHK